MLSRSSSTPMTYTGTFAFATAAHADAALTRAHQRIAEDSDDLHRQSWVRGVTKKGAMVLVKVRGSAAAGQRFAAADALDRLSQHALEGGVEVRQGEAAIDFFGAKAKPLAA